MAAPEKRDYSQVAWPWDGDPNWGPPREGATSDPGEDENWRLACGECELYFPSEIQMKTVEAHWREQHGWPPSAGSMHLFLVWVGLGTPPEGKP